MPIKHPIDFVKDRLISGLSLTKPALDLLAERLDEAARFSGGNINPGLKEKERVSIPALIHRHGRLETAMMCVVVENVASAFLVHNHGVRGAIDRTLPLVSSRAMSTFDSAFDFLLGQAHTLVNAAAKSLDENTLKAPAEAVVTGMDHGLRLALGEDYAVDAREHINALPERASKFVKVKIVKVKAIKDNSRLASLLFSGVVHSSVFGIFGASYVLAFTHVLTIRHKEEDVLPVDDDLALVSSTPLKVANTCTTVARVFVFDFFKGGYVQDVSTVVGHGKVVVEVFAEKNIDQYVLAFPLASVHRPLLIPMNACTTVARIFPFNFRQVLDASPKVAEDTIQSIDAHGLAPVHILGLPAAPLNTCTTVLRVSDVRVWGVDYNIMVSNVFDVEEVVTHEAEFMDVSSSSVTFTAADELNVAEDNTLKLLVVGVVTDAKAADEDDGSDTRFDDAIIAFNDEAEEKEGIVVAEPQISVEEVAVEKVVAEEVVVDLIETVIDSIGINSDAEGTINTTGTVNIVNEENDIVIKKIEKYENICTYDLDNRLENKNKIITIASGIDTHNNDRNYDTIENPKNIFYVCKVSEDLALRDDDLDEKIQENREATHVEGDTFLPRESGAEETVASEGDIFKGVVHAEHLALEIVDVKITEIKEGVVVIAEFAPLEEFEQGEVAAENNGEQAVVEEKFVEDEELGDIVAVDVEVVAAGGSASDHSAIENEIVVNDCSSFKRAEELVSQPIQEEGAWELAIEEEFTADEQVLAEEFTAGEDAFDEPAVKENIGAELIDQEQAAAEDDVFDEEFLLELAIIEQYQHVERERHIAEEVDVDDDMLSDEMLLELAILEKYQFNQDELVVEEPVFDEEMLSEEISEEVLLELAIMEKYQGSDEEQEQFEEEEEEFRIHMLNEVDSMGIEERDIDVEDPADDSNVGEVIFDAGYVDDDEDVEGGGLTEEEVEEEEVEVKGMLVDCNGEDSYVEDSIDQEVDAAVKLSAIVEEGETTNNAKGCDIRFEIAGGATGTDPLDVPNLILDRSSEEVDISEANYQSGEYVCLYGEFEPAGSFRNVPEENLIEEVKIEELLTDHDNSEPTSCLTRCTSMPSIRSAGSKGGPTLSRCVSMDFRPKGSPSGHVGEDICSELETEERVEWVEAENVTEVGSRFEEAHGSGTGKEKEESSNVNVNEKEVVLGVESDVPPAASVSHYREPQSLPPIRPGLAMVIHNRKVKAENAASRTQLPTSWSSKSDLTPLASPFVPKGYVIPNPSTSTPQESEDEFAFRTPVSSHWKSAKGTAVIISSPRPAPPRIKAGNKPSRRERHLAHLGVAKDKGKVDACVLASRDLNIK